ncbi:hypothetical protein GCM10025864_37480 [Luteimicrobium album]|uniref:HelY-like SH3 domain-containing protein n=1 Tax=Luteimicrobium album TaxID=1054550 RepID=A0ABQ6I5D0_9MICO|nr:hypothetical protein GCM10025864_37480 [Luteimicrobium album]
MAVNLVAQVGRDRAREVLETSFAQFQADRGVVGLAKQAQAHAEALQGYGKAMTCDRGDFAEYLGIRRKIAAREAELSRSASANRRAEVAAAFEKLRTGDVVEVPSGRRAGYVVVVDRGRGGGFDGPSPTVLTSEGRAKRLTLADAPAGIAVVGTVRVPKGFNARNARHRKDLVSSMRNALADGRTPPGAQRRGEHRRGRGAPRPTTSSSRACVRRCAPTRATRAPTGRTTRAGANATSASRTSTACSCAASSPAPGRSRRCSTARATCCSSSATSRATRTADRASCA